MKADLQLNFSAKLAVILALISLLIDTSFPRFVSAKTIETGPVLNTVGQLPSSEDRRPRRMAKVVLTAYSSTPEQTDDTPFVTANGLTVYDGLVAANWLPYGTRVKFPQLFGGKIFTVNDRMHPRYGAGRADLWLDASTEEVKKFGVQFVKMEIY